MSYDFVTGTPAHDREFVEALQARAAGLLTDDEAKAVLRRIRPDWFPTIVTGRMARTRFTAKPSESLRSGRWYVYEEGERGWIASFDPHVPGGAERQARRLADSLNETTA